MVGTLVAVMVPVPVVVRDDPLPIIIAAVVLVLPVSALKAVEAVEVELMVMVSPLVDTVTLDPGAIFTTPLLGVMAVPFPWIVVMGTVGMVGLFNRTPRPDTAFQSVWTCAAGIERTTAPVSPFTLCTGAPDDVMKLLSLVSWDTLVGTEDIVMNPLLLVS